MTRNKKYTARQLQLYGSIWWVISLALFLSAIIWGDRVGISLGELGRAGIIMILFGGLIMELMSPSRSRNSTLSNEQKMSGERTAKENNKGNPEHKK